VDAAKIVEELGCRNCEAYRGPQHSDSGQFNRTTQATTQEFFGEEACQQKARR